MLAPHPEPLSPFTLCETHGIFGLPGCRVRHSSAELGWSSLFLSEQDEAPFSAEVSATNDHLIVMHLSDPARVQLEADTMTASAVIPRRSLFVWPAGHGFQISVDAPVETLHLYVRRSLVEEVGLAMGYDGTDLVLDPRLGVYDELLEQLALEARRLASRKDRASLVYVDYLAGAIAARLIESNMLMREEDPQDQRGLAPNKLKCVTQFIDENLAGEIHIPQLSNAAGLSPSHFLRLFKIATGQTPHQFIVRRRVEKAQHLLRSTRQPIAQIAFACGFSHQQHFSNVFAKFTGMTPANYRRAADRRN